VILTSVEFDHADIYKIWTRWRRLSSGGEPGSATRRIVAFDAGASIDRCLLKAFCPVERYGASERADWRIANLTLDAQQTSWSVARWKTMANFEFRWAENTTSGSYGGGGAGGKLWNFERCDCAGSRTFRSVKRRLEVKAEVNGITIIDDFAHHPTAIEQTVRALRARYPQARLWVVLEPRSNTMRRNVLQDALARSLALADQVVVAAIFKSEAIPEAERLDLNRVVDEIRSAESQRAFFPTPMPS